MEKGENDEYEIIDVKKSESDAGENNGLKPTQISFVQKNEKDEAKRSLDKITEEYKRHKAESTKIIESQEKVFSEMTKIIKNALENWEGRIEAIKTIEVTKAEEGLKSMYLADLNEARETLKNLLFFKDVLKY